MVLENFSFSFGKTARILSIKKGKEIALCEKGERNIDNLLLGSVSHSGFARLN